LSRDHTKNLFNLSKNNYTIIIDDPFIKSNLNLENTFFQSAKDNDSAIKAIANHISNISKCCEEESEIVLVGISSGALLLPGIASGLRAHGFSVVGYIFINSKLPGAISPEDTDFEFFQTLPLLSDWPDAPVNYLCSEDNFLNYAKEAELRGWQVINEYSEETIKEVANSLFF
jgi:thioesterase domain-containing protein